MTDRTMINNREKSLVAFLAEAALAAKNRKEFNQLILILNENFKNKVSPGFLHAQNTLLKMVPSMVKTQPLTLSRLNWAEKTSKSLANKPLMAERTVGECLSWASSNLRRIRST